MRMHLLVFTTAASVVMIPLGAAAQSAVPKTSWGTPDLQGVWDFRSLTPMQRPSTLAEQETFTAEEAAEFSQESIADRSRDSETSARAARVAQGDIIPYNDFWFDEGTSVTTTRTSLIVDPPDGRMPPLTPGAQSLRAANRALRQGVGADEPPLGGWVEDLADRVRCTRGFNSGPPLTPSAYNNNMQLFQTPGYVVIMSEMIHDARIVSLDERPHPPSEISLWSGSARGRWDGDTLVVETRNLRADAYQGSTQDMRLIERFTRVDMDTLMYEATVEDPATWTSPWTYQVPMAKNDSLIYEFACHEGNYGLYNILAAAGLR
jgi:hypothetical protein